MTDLRVNIRASSVPAWADCAARASYELQRSGPLPGRPHVGSVVGTLVHQKLLGGDKAQWKLPDFIEWDAHTRNMREMFMQVDLLSERALRGLEEDRGEGFSSWQLSQSEIAMEAEYCESGIRLHVTGHMDGIIERKDYDAGRWMTGSFELKTGINPPRGSWLQTGVYCWLWQNHEPKTTAMLASLSTCVVLWIDRRDGSAQWEERDPKMLSYLAEAQLRNIARHILYGPTYNPSSLSCASCLNAECALRFGGPNVHLPDMAVV